MDMKKQDDKESVASLDESINCITTYDVPKTSNNQQKQQPVCNKYLYYNIIHGKEILIISKKFQALPTKKSSQQQQHSNKIERRMVSATPCACDSGSSLLTQSYENYDIPKNISQVSIMNMYIVFI